MNIASLRISPTISRVLYCFIFCIQRPSLQRGMSRSDREILSQKKILRLVPRHLLYKGDLVLRKIWRSWCSKKSGKRSSKDGQGSLITPIFHLRWSSPAMILRSSAMSVVRASIPHRRSTRSSWSSQWRTLAIEIWKMIFCLSGVSLSPIHARLYCQISNEVTMISSKWNSGWLNADMMKKSEQRQWREKIGRDSSKKLVK